MHPAQESRSIEEAFGDTQSWWNPSSICHSCVTLGKVLTTSEPVSSSVNGAVKSKGKSSWHMEKQLSKWELMGWLVRGHVAPSPLLFTDSKEADRVPGPWADP